jgi:hypothetical protein
MTFPLESSKCVDAEVRDDINEMVLDYLVFHGVQALLDQREAERAGTLQAGEGHNADLALEMVDCKFTIITSDFMVFCQNRHVHHINIAYILGEALERRLNVTVGSKLSAVSLTKPI